MRWTFHSFRNLISSWLLFFQRKCMSADAEVHNNSRERLITPFGANKNEELISKQIVSNNK